MNLTKIIKKYQPDEIYNLGAMSHVKVSFDTPEYVGNVDGLGTLRILEAVRLLGLEKKTRIYQASTSELYGGMSENKNENGFYDENSFLSKITIWSCKTLWLLDHQKLQELIICLLVMVFIQS